MTIKQTVKYIYLPVRQDKFFLRLIKVVGWILMVVSHVFFPLTFLIYFGVLQRVLLYLVYGEDKAQWEPISKSQKSFEFESGK